MCVVHKLHSLISRKRRIRYKSVDRRCQVYMHILRAHPGGAALGDACTDDRDKVGTKPDSTHRRGKESNCGPRLTLSNRR